mgnify:CR=1 FL=1
MSEEAPKFGPVDIGGSKFDSPTKSDEANTRLVEESINRKRFSRYFATGSVVFLSIAAASCLAFSMWVGKHFLEGLDQQKDKEAVMAAAKAVDTPTAPPQKINSKLPIPSTKNTTSISASSPSADEVQETFYLRVLAPLIPAFFSSFIAIILFITIARLVTNFERMGRESSEKDKNDDYGTIATLFEELGKLIKSFKKE